MADFSWASVADKAFDNLRNLMILVFVILGTGLILLAANKGYSQAHLSFSDALSIKVLASLGGLFILVAIISFFLSGSTQISLSKMQKKYEIKIHLPLPNSTVPSPIQVSGTCKRTGATGSFYAIEYNPAVQQYWPKGPLAFDHQKKTWRATMNIGGGNNQPRFLIVAYVGEGSQRLLDYYERVRQDTGRHLGIRQFPPDFYPLSQIEVILQRPPEPQTVLPMTVPIQTLEQPLANPAMMQPGVPALAETAILVRFGSQRGEIPLMEAYAVKKGSPTLRTINDGHYGEVVDVSINMAEDEWDCNVIIGRDARKISIVARPDNSFIFYLKVNVAATTGDVYPNKWIAIRSDVATVSKGKNQVEKAYPATWKADVGYWMISTYDIEDVVEACFGDEGWKYHQLLALRVRGKGVLARVTLL